MKRTIFPAGVVLLVMATICYAWNCPKCKTKNVEQGKFCGECGTKKPAPKPPATAGWKCPKCGESNAPSNKFCGKCGLQRGKKPTPDGGGKPDGGTKPPPVDPPDKPKPPEPPAVAGWKCPGCAQANPSDADNCTRCGGKVVWPCPDCGQKNAMSRKLCGKCGKRNPFNYNAAPPQDKPTAQAPYVSPPPLQVSGALSVKVMLSTGETLTGALGRARPDEVPIRTKAGQESCWKANIVTFELQWPEHLRATVASLGDTSRVVATGKVLLEKGFPDLAAMQFAAALQRVQSALPDIKKAYAEAKRPLPEVLGGAPPRDPRKRAKPRPYVFPTQGMIKDTRNREDELTAAVKKYAPKMHLIEAEHFRIYSAGSKTDDKRLRTICDRLYSTLCKQFAIPPREHIWIGKLPVYVFLTEDSFIQYMVEVAGEPADLATRGMGNFSVWPTHRIMLKATVRDGASKTQAHTLFHRVLVHETSHAFLIRYINSRPIPNWVDEGIAEYMAATLVPESWSAQRYINASREAVSLNKPIDKIFTEEENIPGGDFHYGVAQSLVRYLVGRDKMKFIDFVKLLKEGKSGEDALQETYGLTYKTLTLAWRKAIR